MRTAVRWCAVGLYSHTFYCLQLFYNSSLVFRQEDFNLKSYWIIYWNIIKTLGVFTECRPDTRVPTLCDGSSLNHHLSNLLLNHLTIPRSSSYCQAMFIQDYRVGGESRQGRGGGGRGKYLFSSPQPVQQMIAHSSYSSEILSLREFQLNCLSQHGLCGASQTSAEIARCWLMFRRKKFIL